MEKFIKFENETRICLEQLDIDFMPLHDVFRTIFGFEKLVPTENEFFQTIELVEILIANEDVICTNEIGLNFTNKSVSEIISFLTEKWKAGKYDEINYSVWFDKR